MKRCPTCGRLYNDEAVKYCRVDGTDLAGESPEHAEVQTKLLGVVGDGSRMSAAPKLCVCGRSRSYPLCDNSHAEDGWTCASNSTREEVGFVSSFRYENLARKLASHLKGALCFPGSPVSAVDRLVIISDGTDLDYLLPLSRAVRARERVVFTFEVKPGLVGTAYGSSRAFGLGDVQPAKAFGDIMAVLEGRTNEAGIPPAVRMRSALISHAAADEVLLTPAANYLRSHFQADLYPCADPVDPVENWQAITLEALLRRECLISLLSKADLTPFSAFATGMAAALKKPIFVLSTDGTKPPPFIVPTRWSKPCTLVQDFSCYPSPGVLEVRRDDGTQIWQPHGQPADGASGLDHQVPLPRAAG